MSAAASQVLAPFAEMPSLRAGGGHLQLLHPAAMHQSAVAAPARAVLSGAGAAGVCPTWRRWLWPLDGGG